MRRLFLLVIIIAAAAVSARADYPEVDKKTMKASGSPSFWFLNSSISGDPSSDAVAAYGQGSWARYDLGRSYRLDKFQHQPGMYTDKGHIKDFEIYVTDVLSDNRPDWGPYAYRGIAADNPARKTIPLHNDIGRYVIIYMNSVYGTQARLSDVWIYGEPVTFEIASPTTGCATFTNSTTVDVVFHIPEDQKPTGFAVTESEEPPKEWLEKPPASYAFAKPAEEGPLTLYGWWKDDSNPAKIMHEKATITYTTEAPTARAKDIEVPASAGYPVVVRPFDVDDGSIDLAGMGITRHISCPQDQTPDQPYLTLPDHGQYKATLIVTNSAGTSARAVCTIKIVPTQPTSGDAVWAGDANDNNWSLGANWRGGRCPANPGGIVHFFDAGSARPEDITSVLDCPADTWAVAGFKCGSSPYSQHLDLNRKKLLIDGEFWLGDMIPAKQMIFSNGTLQIGKPGNPADMTIAYRSSYNPIGSTGTLTIGSKTSKTEFIPYLNECNVGYSPMWVSAGPGILDLRNCTLANNTLQAKTLRVGSRGAGYIQLNEKTHLKNIIVDGDCTIGSGGGNALGRIGDPDNDYKLPPDVNLTIGAPGSLSLFGFAVPHSYYGQNGDAMLAATSGGRFEAYLSAMNIAATLKGGGPCVATLDLQQMDGVAITAESARIGSAEGDGTMSADVSLPVGEFSANELVLGKTPKGHGRLTLFGTMLRPQSFTIGSKGTLKINILAESGGLDLAEGAKLVIADGGKIAITSIAVPQTAVMQWGIRWKGDHVAALQELNQAKKLVWNGLQLPVGVFLQDGFTYVGLKAGVPRIAEFVLTDRTSGSETTANSRTVNARCEIRNGAAAINGYCILDSPEEPQAAAPDTWLPAFPDTAAIKGPIGQKTFYAWIRDAAGNVCGRSYSINFGRMSISKQKFTVAASSEEAGHPAGAALDGAAAGTGWLAKQGQGSWLKIDLGAPCYLGWIQVDSDAAYEVFVADAAGPESGAITVEEARKAWGQPLGQKIGKEKTCFATPKAGRYVILYQNEEKPAELHEVWLGLIPQDPFRWSEIAGAAAD